MQQPLINWKELVSIGRPPMPPQPRDGENMWDKFADNYNRMAALEAKLTMNQINAIPCSCEDTVLDFGCGPGRIAVPMAKRAKSLTAADSAEKMLEHCRQNAENAGLTNFTTRFLDFNKAQAGVDIEKHDVVICSRSAGLHDLEKLSSFSNKITAIIIWANAPAIPHLLGTIFDGCSDDAQKRPPMREDRRLAYNVFYNVAYDLGYEPNVSVVPDGFTRDYESKEDAYKDLIQLGQVDDDKMDIFKENLEKYFKINENGKITFFMETRSAVIWWETNPKKFF